MSNCIEMQLFMKYSHCRNNLETNAEAKEYSGTVLYGHLLFLISWLRLDKLTVNFDLPE
jgi:hypothetical protein